MYYLYKRLFEANTCSKKVLRARGSGNNLIQHILFALEENAIHLCYKPVDPSKVNNTHRFGPPTSIPHWHRQQEEEDPHLHTGDNKSKA
jgi:hypothetical protein